MSDFLLFKIIKYVTRYYGSPLKSVELGILLNFEGCKFLQKVDLFTIFSFCIEAIGK